MNEEEKKAIEYSKNCLMKITLGIDCEFDVNILDTLLNIIKKQDKMINDMALNIKGLADLDYSIKEIIENFERKGENRNWKLKLENM